MFTDDVGHPIGVVPHWLWKVPEPSLLIGGGEPRIASDAQHGVDPVYAM
jgi:hypothetical protein